MIAPKTALYVCLAALLAGCERRTNFQGTNAAPQTMLIMGQSNGYFYYAQGGFAQTQADFKSHGISINEYNCAIIGSSMDHWVPAGDFYEACMKNVASNRITPTSVFFWQGENDMGPGQPEVWASKFYSMTADLKHRWPNITIYYARVNKEWIPASQEGAELYHVQSHISGAIMLDIDGLTGLLPLSPHFSNPDYQLAGNWLYELMTTGIQ
jgi:hypothetical protein